MKEKVAESTLSPRHLFPQSPLPPSFAHTRDMQQLLKPQELAEIINVSPPTIMKWYYDGIIPARSHVGRIVRFELDAVMIALTERLEARVPAPIKELIGRAASLEGVSLTDYVIATLQKNAAMVVREHEVLNLSVKDSAAFAKAMLAAPKPNRKLTQAFASHQQSVTVK